MTTLERWHAVFVALTGVFALWLLGRALAADGSWVFAAAMTGVAVSQLVMLRANRRERLRRQTGQSPRRRL
jgi:hypothetical protein